VAEHLFEAESEQSCFGNEALRIIGHQVEGVLALGTAAADAWTMWKTTPRGQTFHVAFAPVTHPTQPENSSKGDKSKPGGRKGLPRLDLAKNI